MINLYYTWRRGFDRAVERRTIEWSFTRQEADRKLGQEQPKGTVDIGYQQRYLRPGCGTKIARCL